MQEGSVCTDTRITGITCVPSENKQESSNFAMPSPPHLPQNGKTKNLPKNVPFTPGHTLWEQQEEAQADKDSEISQAIQ